MLDPNIGCILFFKAFFVNSKAPKRLPLSVNAKEGILSFTA
jgi:hypothetical protein